MKHSTVISQLVTDSAFGLALLAKIFLWFLPAGILLSVMFSKSKFSDINI